MHYIIYIYIYNNLKSFANRGKSIIRNNLGLRKHSNLGHKCFYVNTANFLRTAFYRTILVAALELQCNISNADLN